MASAPDLTKAAIHLAQILGPQDCVLVGGMAVGVHGYVRATKDVDFVARLKPADVIARLKLQGIATTQTHGDVLEGDFPCVKGTLDGVPFDVMPPLVPIDWEDTLNVPMGGGVTLPVVSLEGLIRLKMRAAGPRDLLDVAALVMQHPEQLDLARELAVAYRVADKLDIWLRDPRLKAEIESPRPTGRKGRRKSS
jgi:hypothetical protein